MIRPRFPSFAAHAVHVAVVALGLLAAAAPASADVYKIVAPDGHVTYSDRKPDADVQKQTSVIGGAGTQRPMVPPMPGPSGPPKLYLPPAPASENAAKQAILGLGRGEAARDPKLLEALVTADGYEALVQGYVEICAGTMPSSLARFNAAARAWHRENDQVLTQAGSLRKNLFSAPQLAAMQDVAQGRADIVLAQVKAASEEPRIRWCDLSTDALKSPLLSLSTKAPIALGFARYVTQ